MRKIDKSQILSKAYKNWEEALRISNEPHPPYGKYKGHKHYDEIVMSLYYCQKGLCAYTEMELCAKEDWAKSNWEDGKYLHKRKKMPADLEHFDERLKAKSGATTGIKDY